MKSTTVENRPQDDTKMAGDAIELASMADPHERDRFSALLCQHGDSSLSCQAPYLPFLWICWLGPDVAVPFRRGNGVWLSLGPPIAATGVIEATEAFCRAARAHGAHAAFFGLDAALVEKTSLQFWVCAEDPICLRSRWPEESPAHVPRVHLARQSRRGARTVRIETKSAQQADTQGRPLLDAFIARQAMPPLGFAALPSLRADHDGARHWFAYSPDGLEGALVGLPNSPQGTWLIEAVFRRVGAPNGTSELLIDTAMRELEGAERVSLGMLALHGPVPKILAIARSVGRSLYSFAGLASFRRRLLPDEERVLTLAYPKETGPMRAVWATAMAFCHGRPWRFALRLLVRGPRLVLWLQAAALVPWTIGLALLPWTWCFSHPYTQRAWVAFDVVLIFWLARLAYRPTIKLAYALWLVVCADVTLTSIEMFLRPAPTSLRDVLAHAITIGAPLASSIVLRGTHRRLCRLERHPATKP